jgi:ABC-type transporter Mla subunit MlaD
LSLLDDEECLNRRQIREIQRKLSEKQEEAVAIIDAQEYSSRTNKTALQQTTDELEKLEAEYRETLNRVQTYLDNTINDTLSTHSQKTSSHLEQVMCNISTDANYIPGDQLETEQQKSFQTNRFEEQYQSTPYSKSTTTQSEPQSIYGDS